MTAQATEGLTTPETLSDELVSFYRTNGYVHVPNVLSAEEVAEFRADSERQLKGGDTQAWDEGDAVVFDWVSDVNKRSDILRRLTMHPSVTGIAERLAGGPLRMFKSELLRKAGNKNANTLNTPAHEDMSAMPFISNPYAIIAWVPLVDVPVALGPMRYWPGSQHRPLPDRWDDEGMLAPLTYWPELAYQQQDVVPARAGDVQFHNEWCVHGADANVTDTDRLVLFTVYVSADAVYENKPFYTGMFPEDADLGGLKPGEPLALRDERFCRVGKAAP
ncbi:phytanoyl-CoA dioxygenase family protein [Kibdelosporangium aridum]|uniref:Ectoine hydroxylase-related dioxygenase, phytanoyl-CoA dioxygenase (PhyH) family n=1 Tax=Kibdelosporangium aridum TaxID=2030 RepID=A0A1W2FVH4_KIBAR|nr:phytanoyl-CoA dioxygenase family protein [Kibdelosporangium aridum]SMD25891.1 Ectoine hydroxylase-related dioxygenase, phytanoyl-CoA dioxygenase (PhyH) family [Kibdelosporangium aridum]